jgi:hypothetical protein
VGRLSWDADFHGLRIAPRYFPGAAGNRIDSGMKAICSGRYFRHWDCNIEWSDHGLQASSLIHHHKETTVKIIY